MTTPQNDAASVQNDAARVRAWNAKPIGYVVKHMDETLNAYVGALLAEFECERGHWQLMRRVHENPGLSLAGFVEDARVFYEPDRVHGFVDDLTGRGWLTLDGDAMQLTDVGETRFAAMSERQDGTLDRMLTNLTVDDYLTTVRLLETMADNLENAMAGD